jgi:hypothetical protein
MEMFRATLPIEADLAPTDETIGVARPTVAEVHTSIEALPNRRIVRSVKAGRPTGTIGGRWNRRSCRDEQGQCSNANPEESECSLLRLCPAPDNGKEPQS